MSRQPMIHPRFVDHAVFRVADLALRNASTRFFWANLQTGPRQPYVRSWRYTFVLLYLR
jgi:hypothetical protein